MVQRFPSVDPIADQFAFVSPFNYAENEPVRHIDLHGLQKHDLMGHHDVVNQQSFESGGAEQVKEDQKVFTEAFIKTAVVAAPLVLPGPEDIVIGGLALTKFGGAVMKMADDAVSGLKGMLKSTDEAAEESVTLYRGINEDSPAFDDALEGIANPRGGKGGHTNAAKHNRENDGTVDSAMTSWTTDEDVALNYAFRPSGNRGAVMTKKFSSQDLIVSPNTKRVNLKHKPGTIVSESEVLVKGKVSGAQSQVVRLKDY